jgi:hypothetical protein
MGMEGFNSKAVNARSETPPETDDHELEQFKEKLDNAEGVDFSLFLGEGFDAEFFADKLAPLPSSNKSFEAWNDFLRQDEGGKFSDRKIELSLLYKIVDKLIGAGDAPMLFPVFIKAVQDFGEARGIPSDHVTPERMERFYHYVVGGVPA